MRILSCILGIFFCVNVMAQNVLKQGIFLSIIYGNDTVNKVDYLGKQGKWVSYNKNDKIVSIKYYCNNKLNGSYYEKTSNSNSVKGQYREDKKIDTFYYYKRGKIEAYYIYDSLENDVEHTYFYRNGNKKFTTNYFVFNNFPYPYYQNYYRNGNKKMTSKILDSKGTEEVVFYYKNGKIKK